MNEEACIRFTQIVKEHPLLYMQYVSFACFGGWLDLIEDLSDKLEEEIEKDLETSSHGNMMYCTDIREKNGRLHFYMSHATDKMVQMIAESENKSFEICEMCGKPGRLRDEFYVATLCDEHAKKGGIL